MEEALTAYLLGATALTTLIGPRLTWGVRQQGAALPALVLNKIDALPDYQMQGPSGLVSARVQADCWASTYAAARGTARAVVGRLSGLSQSISDGNSPETVTVLRGGFLVGDRDGYETEAGGASLYRVSLDFIIWHKPG